MIDVSDEGEGVAEDMTEMIFEKGVSAHGSTGIGLLLARDLIKGNGGRLELKQNKPQSLPFLCRRFRPALTPIP